MAEKKKIPAPAPEAVPLHRPEVDAAPHRAGAADPPPAARPGVNGLVPFFHLCKQDPARWPAGGCRPAGRDSPGPHGGRAPPRRWALPRQRVHITG